MRAYDDVRAARGKDPGGELRRAGSGRYITIWKVSFSIEVLRGSITVFY